MTVSNEMTYEEYYEQLNKTFAKLLSIDLEDVIDYDFQDLYERKVDFKEACLEILEYDGYSAEFIQNEIFIHSER